MIMDKETYKAIIEEQNKIIKKAKEKKESLSEKRLIRPVMGRETGVYFEEDVKEKIQDFEKELKAKIKQLDYRAIGISDVVYWIDKLHDKYFGSKLR